ncbi:hypothetical protein Hanom_Chr06g00528101 [Helianthus anomalus]
MYFMFANSCRSHPLALTLFVFNVKSDHMDFIWGYFGHFTLFTQINKHKTI